MIDRLMTYTRDFGRLFVILMLAAMSVTPVCAQRNRSKAKPKPKQLTTEEILRENLLQAVRKVVIVDSVVVPKSNFVKHIPLPPECGKIEQVGEGFQYTNEFGDRMLLSVADTTTSHVYSKIKEGGEWGKQKYEESLAEANYPFLMTDGITLYLSKRGEETLGGYDIFVTRYDSDDKEYLKPQNIGFPFNSEANDYLYIEDELDSLGWFVTDRRQEEGMVCIYTFVPPSSHDTYSIEDDDVELVRDRAAITSISDTWNGNYKELNSAKERLSNLIKRQSVTVKKSDFTFVINDDVVYTNADDFKAPGNRQNIQQLQNLKKTLEKEEKELDEARVKYHSTSEFRRDSQKNIILAAEKDVAQLRSEIADLTKQIRNEEIKYLSR